MNQVHEIVFTPLISATRLLLQTRLLLVQINHCEPRGLYWETRLQFYARIRLISKLYRIKIYLKKTHPRRDIGVVVQLIINSLWSEQLGQQV